MLPTQATPQNQPKEAYLPDDVKLRLKQLEAEADSLQRIRTGIQTAVHFSEVLNKPDLSELYDFLLRIDPNVEAPLGARKDYQQSEFGMVERICYVYNVLVGIADQHILLPIVKAEKLELIDAAVEPGSWQAISAYKNESIYSANFSLNLNENHDFYGLTFADKALLDLKRTKDDSGVFFDALTGGQSDAQLLSSGYGHMILFVHQINSAGTKLPTNLYLTELLKSGDISSEGYQQVAGVDYYRELQLALARNHLFCRLHSKMPAGAELYTVDSDQVHRLLSPNSSLRPYLKSEISQTAWGKSMIANGISYYNAQLSSIIKVADQVRATAPEKAFIFLVDSLAALETKYTALQSNPHSFSDITIATRLFHSGIGDSLKSGNVRGNQTLEFVLRSEGSVVKLLNKLKNMYAADFLNEKQRQATF